MHEIAHVSKLIIIPSAVVKNELNCRNEKLSTHTAQLLEKKILFASDN